jgi:PAS domain-containing protein
VVETPENSHAMDLALLKRGGRLSYETTLQGPDGKTHRVMSTKAAYRDSDGKIGGIVGTWVDMTEQKKAKKTLRERERYFRSILANMHEDIFVIGRDYRIRDVNRKRRQVVGRRCYEVLRNAGRPCSMD